MFTGRSRFLMGLAAAVCLALPHALVAQTKDTSRFGSAGQLSLSSGLAFQFNWTDIEDVDAQVTQFLLNPAADYFILENVSLGGEVGVEFGSIKIPGAKVDNLGVKVGPRVGYAIPLSDKLTLWPKLGLRYGWSETKEGGLTADQHGLDINTYVPLLYHFTNSFFLGFGPTLSYDMWKSDDGAQAFNVGFATSIGGNFDL